MTNPVQSVMSGNNTTGHVITTSIAGDAAAKIIAWVLTAVLHLPVPDSIELSMGILCTLGASILGQKLGT